MPISILFSNVRGINEVLNLDYQGQHLLGNGVELYLNPALWPLGRVAFKALVEAYDGFRPGKYSEHV